MIPAPTTVLAPTATRAAAVIASRTPPSRMLARAYWQVRALEADRLYTRAFTRGEPARSAPIGAL